MISVLTSVISSLRPRQHIEERLTLIIDFTIFYSGFFSGEAFDKRTNRVSTDVADKHARYISEIAASPAKSKVTNELGDNGAHRCVDYCFCKRTAIISAAKVRHCKRKDSPRCLVPLPREWRPTGHVFLASSCLTPNKGDLLYLIRNKVDY